MWKSRKYYKILICSMLCVILISLLVGCGKSKEKEVAKAFIMKMTSCETYKNASTDKNLMYTAFNEYFEEEGYEKFLNDKIPYIYPQLFYMTDATSTQLIRLENTASYEAGGKSVLEYTIKYGLKTKKDTTMMRDQIRLEVSKENKIGEVLILNHSDIMHKLFIDIKVQ